jgi:hypothetical protein
MIYRGLYHFQVAHQKGLAADSISDSSSHFTSGGVCDVVGALVDAFCGGVGEFAIAMG